jgi:hypothetical protein
MYFLSAPGCWWLIIILSVLVALSFRFFKKALKEPIMKKLKDFGLLWRSMREERRARKNLKAMQRAWPEYQKDNVQN